MQGQAPERLSSADATAATEPRRLGRRLPKGHNFSSEDWVTIAAWLREGRDVQWICDRFGIKMRTFYDRMERGGKSIRTRTERTLFDLETGEPIGVSEPSAPVASGAGTASLSSTPA